MARLCVGENSKRGFLELSRLRARPQDCLCWLFCILQPEGCAERQGAIQGALGLPAWG